MNRYIKQTVFSKIGIEGQQKLLNSKVAIIGLGALGTVSANNLCRSGVGHIKIIDRDYVELSNLQRQNLYTEEDATQRLPKAIAAFNNLTKVNSEITIEPHIKDVNSANIEDLIHDVDLVLDATDNWEIRFLINEACLFLGIPWIYCAAIGSEAMTMNFLFNKTKNYINTPCIKCFIPDSVINFNHSCSTFGVLNMATSTIASIQTAEALKILIGSDAVRHDLFKIDLWTNHSAVIKFEKNNECPICVHKNYNYFRKISASNTINLCGTNSVQIMPSVTVDVDFNILADRLERIGSVAFNKYTLTFVDSKYEITVFKDGRAIIKNAVDENNAKSIYTEYLGM